MVNGFLIIDKQAGLSSHDVVNRVRRILGTKKVGHTGTLDPFATGLLPIAVGEATKTIQFLDEGIKSYLATVRLGIVTDTLDITGKIVEERDPASITEQLLLEKIRLLTGDIRQVPPMYSAIKQGGQPLYKLARKGIEVERPSRSVTIHQFNLLSYTPPELKIQVICSRGTYIRTLAADLGRDLGSGACLTELRRTGSGSFDLADAMTTEQLELAAELGQLQQIVIPVKQALQHLPDCELSDTEQALLANGVIPTRLSTVHQNGLIRFSYKEKLIAVAESNGSGKVQLKRVFNR